MAPKRDQESNDMAVFINTKHSSYSQILNFAINLHD